MIAQVEDYDEEVNGEEGVGDYEVDEKARNILMTDEGFAHAEEILGVTDLYESREPLGALYFQCG